MPSQYFQLCGASWNVLCHSSGNTIVGKMIPCTGFEVREWKLSSFFQALCDSTVFVALNVCKRGDHFYVIAVLRLLLRANQVGF